MGDRRAYSEAEVRAILERALEHQSAQAVSHADLVSAAEEIGISREAIENAARSVEEGRAERSVRERIRARRRRGLANHFFVYIGVNALLALGNLLSTPEVPWFLFPLIAWGIGFFFHARAALSKEVSPRAIHRKLVLERRASELGAGANRPGTRIESSSPEEQAEAEEEVALMEHQRRNVE
jgi:hypothetical protein